MERRRERVKHERETDRVTRTEDERPVSSLPFPFLSSHIPPCHRPFVLRPQLLAYGGMESEETRVM